MKTTILSLMALFILSGCMATGVNFTFQDATKVQVGDSREVVVQKMKGKPYMVRPFKKDGEVMTIYNYTYSDGFSTKSLSFVLKDDKVVETPIIPKELLE